ncbi:cytidylyltransferase domain-containing protein [Alistipes sp.]|uniref:cytidylyltransferase domain-containing protein n=1 Tax=Alistipes sp. TaxID=1872444 RepID=UPI003A8BA413
MNLPIVVLQARTGSSRLPFKMLRPFYEEKSILEILLTRMKSAIPEPERNIVVATTVDAGDDAIVELCDRLGVKSFRGSRNDVLSRFIGVAGQERREKLIRVCADNVFLDMRALRMLYDALIATDADYLSFMKSDGTPSIRTHYGFWAEGVTSEALKRVAASTDEAVYHEHVTNFIYGHPDLFRCSFMPVEDSVEGVENHPYLRLTVDTLDDFEVQRAIYSDFMSGRVAITPANLIAYLDERPALYEVMRKNIEINSK